MPGSPPSSKSRRGGPRKSSAERRGSLIEAILDVFVENGVDGVRTKLISERAGVAETILYRHFTSKDAMLETAVYETVLHRMKALAARVGTETGDSTERPEAVAAFHRLFLSAMVDSAPLIAVAVFQEGEKAAEFYRQHLWPALDAVFEAADAALQLSTRYPGPRKAAIAMIFGMHLGIALDAWLRGLVLDVPTVAADLSALLRAG